MLNRVIDRWKRLRRPRRDTVSFDAERVLHTMSDGRTESVRWDALARVAIVTTDEGPFVDDVFWMLVGAGGTSGCAVPSTAEGASALFARLGELPGFDYMAAVQAAGSCENATFVCWDRARSDTA